VRPVSPFNHEGREVAAITHWRLRSHRYRIEPAALVSGAPQNKNVPHAGRKTMQEDQENFICLAARLRRDIEMTFISLDG
jgi:hypothetical protein